MLYLQRGWHEEKHEEVDYYGMSGVLALQTPKQAANLRKDWHGLKPAFPLRKCTLGQISVVEHCLRNKTDALIEEATHIP